MQKSRFRTKQYDFTMVSNEILFNNDLTRDARILYMMIQAKITIPDFILYKTTLIKLFGANEKTFDKYWKELKTKGYLIQYKFRDEDNKYYYEYELLDKPDIELASKIHAENNTPKQAQEKDEEESKKPDPTFWGGGSLEGWKTGVYNNTDLNNTDLNNINTTTHNAKHEQEKDSKESVVVDTTNKDLIESKSNLALTPYQSKTVSKWSEEKLHRALEIYNLNDGQTFALLLKIYKAGAINNLNNTNMPTQSGSVSKKIANYNNIPSHDFDFDEIERLERQYIERKLSRDHGEYEQ